MGIINADLDCAVYINLRERPPSVVLGRVFWADKNAQIAPLLGIAGDDREFGALLFQAQTCGIRYFEGDSFLRQRGDSQACGSECMDEWMICLGALLFVPVPGSIMAASDSEEV